MTNTQLMQIFDALVASARTTMGAKNHDYTAASEDALKNFKVVGEMLGLQPRQVWAVYFMKHVMAVLAWAKTGKVESEGLAGRFLDLVNYAAIGNALLQETGREEPNLGFPGLWDDVAQWSTKTFGTEKERGPAGALKHITKEVQEALQKPDDPKEYADLIILVCDASRRAGLSMEALLKAAHAKMAENKKRTWPKPVDDEPCEHVKEPATTFQEAAEIEAQTPITAGGAGEERHPWKSPPLTGPNPYLKAAAEPAGEPRPGGGSRATVTEDPTPKPKTPLKYVGEPGPGSEDWGQATS